MCSVLLFARVSLLGFALVRGRVVGLVLGLVLGSGLDRARGIGISTRLVTCIGHVLGLILSCVQVFVLGLGLRLVVCSWSGSCC